jgi:hypothetical protein
VHAPPSATSGIVLALTVFSLISRSDPAGATADTYQYRSVTLSDQQQLGDQRA